MKKKILAYEKFIASKVSDELNEKERAKLAELHSEMVRNFQHERLIHLIVTLFFAALTIVVVFLTAESISIDGLVAELIPLYILALLLIVLTACYIKHYYFLENHIQGLYKYTKKLLK
jgi:uncharacterized Tic20 family protein